MVKSRNLGVELLDFPTNHCFKPSDIQFVGKRLGLLFFDDLLDDYNRKTYNRHRKIILAHFGYDAFKLQKHHFLIIQLMNKSLWSFDRAHLILGNILDWLEHRHIELPSYYGKRTVKYILQIWLFLQVSSFLGFFS